MGDKTGIAWTEATWNPVAGCSLKSPGCKLCYAMDEAARQVRIAEAAGRRTHYAGTVETVKGVNVWTGKIAVAPDHIFERPMRWTKPRLIFSNSMSDLFHENTPTHVIDRAFAVMALGFQHTYQVLTKRSARMRAYLSDPEARERITAEMWRISRKRTDHMRGGWPLRNVWLGVSTEDQERAEERIPDLLATPAVLRFISAEPLIGPIRLRNMRLRDPAAIGAPPHHDNFDALHPIAPRRIDWVIAGGESDRGSERARPMHPDWVRTIRDDCAAYGTPFFFKQWGNWLPVIDRDKDDPDWRKPYTTYREPEYQILNLAGGRGFHGDRVHVVKRMKKEAAGNTIDGRTHEEIPEARA